LFGIFISGLILPLPIFIALATLYALFKPGYGLIVVAVLIDAQFGSAGGGFPYLYTAIAGTVVLTLEFLKPHLSIYTEQHEI